MAKTFPRQFKGKKGDAEKSWLTKLGQVETTQGQIQKHRDQEQQNAKPRGEGLKTLAKFLAIALISVGVLAVEITTYCSLRQLSEEQIENAQQAQPISLLPLLLMGAVATASGALATFWLSLILRSAQTRKKAAQKKGTNQESTEARQLLTKATAKIRAGRNQEELLQTAVQEARQAIAADRVIFYSLEGPSQGQVIAEAVDFRYPQALGAQIDDPCFQTYYREKYQNGRVQATDDIHQANLTACHIAQLEPLAVKANLVIPILTQEQLIGLLIAHHCAVPHPWQPWEIEVMVQIAQQVGLSIERAYLVTEVAQVSKLFLEQLPTVADVARVVLDNAQQAHSQVQQTSQTLKAGCQVANQTVDELTELQENMAQTVNKINYVDKSSRQISQLVTLIEQLVVEISLQGANILIKARKMGEDTASSPPSALAQKMQSLREDLAEATAAIQSLVSTINTQVNDLNLSLKAKTEKVVKGTEGVEATRQKLHQIDGVTEQMSMLLGNIITVTGQGIETSTATTQAIVETTNLLPQNLEQFEVVADSLTKLVEVYQQAQAGLVSPENTPPNSQERDESKL